MPQSLITLQDTVYKPESIISSDIDEGIVMMDIEKGQYYSLNTMGSRIWKMIDEPIGVRQVCDHLMSEFDISQQQCQKEVLTYLAQLLELGIVKTEDKSN